MSKCHFLKGSVYLIFILNVQNNMKNVAWVLMLWFNRRPHSSFLVKSLRSCFRVAKFLQKVPEGTACFSIGIVGCVSASEDAALRRSLV